MTIKPAGRSANTWSTWSTPDAVVQHQIPPSPGVYQLGVFRQGQLAVLHSPVDQDPRRLSAAKQNAAIVYVGKAVCLRERYWALVESWKHGNAPLRHGSRKNYNQNHRNAKSHFSPGEIRCRYLQVGSGDWLSFRKTLKAGLAKSATWEDQLAALWPDHGQLADGLTKRAADRNQDRPYETVIRTFSEERKILKEFAWAFGVSPLLNKRPPEKLGDSPTDAELEAWFKRESEQLDRIPDEHMIRSRAYSRWAIRGHPLGEDWVDWFDAELELWERALLDD